MMPQSYASPLDSFGLSFQVIEGVDKGALFEGMSIPLTIGRGDESTVRLSDSRVSSCHARIVREGGQIRLLDEDSTNGTRVNGRRTRQSQLGFGDRIGVGRSVLVITFPAGSM
jgi:pSer/pThr/pTyr-binding forkhead associated (FHA) protein